MATPKTDWRKNTFLNSLEATPFFLMHLAVIGIFFVPFKWEYAALCAFTYAARMFGITAGYHRYFSHRTYKANRVVQFLIAALGSSAVQKGVLWWAANHRLHHRYSDLPQDVHSPVQRGFWWSHLGWILDEGHSVTRWDQIQDLARFPELRFINRFHLIPVVALGAATYLLGGLGGFFWGFILSTVILWHSTFFINSLAHVWGSRRYQTTDASRNNFWLALLTLGEGWHNNHHAYMSSTRQGFFWWEVDVSYYILRVMNAVGLVSDLREPPLALLENKRIKAQSSAHQMQTTTAPLAVRAELT